MKKEKIKYLLIILLSIFLGLYLYELFYINNYFGLKKIFLLKNLNKNQNLTNIVPPSDFLKTNDNYKLDFFPLSGISNKKTLHCNENGYYSEYVSDRFGFNNTDKIWDNENDENVYLIGDSFVHGACIYPKFNFSNNLSKLSKNKVNFFNLGYSGNGPLLNFAILKEFYNTKFPEKIIWFHTEVNDLIDLNKEIENPILKKYLIDNNFSQNYIINYNKYLPHLEKQEKKLKLYDQKKDIFKKFLKLYHLRKNIVSKNYNDQNLKFVFNDNYKKILLETKYLLEKNGSELYFVYLPSWFRYNNKNFRTISEVQKSQIKSFLNNNDIEFIDIDLIFFSNKNNKNIYFPFGLNGHYNEKGYIEISNKIYNYIYN